MRADLAQTVMDSSNKGTPENVSGETITQQPTEHGHPGAKTVLVPQDDTCPAAESRPTQYPRTEIEDLQDRLGKAESWMIWLTGAIAFFGLCAVIVGVLQWSAMRGQLAEMKSGGTDTHALAVAAGEQVKELTASIEEARRLAKATETANSNVLEADRPWVGIALAVENFEVGKSPGTTLEFINSGRRPARITHTQYRWVTSGVFPKTMDYPATQTMIGSTNFVLPNMKTSVNFTMDAITEAQMQLLKAKQFTTYVYANVEYDDPVTDIHHWTHACWEYVSFEKGIRSGFYNCAKYNEAK